MSEFDEDQVQNWEKQDEAATWNEEQPYRECPHCGEYKFRVLRRHPRGGDEFDIGEYEYKERCKHCKYHGDEWNDKDD